MDRNNLTSGLPGCRLLGIEYCGSDSDAERESGEISSSDDTCTTEVAVDKPSCLSLSVEQPIMIVDGEHTSKIDELSAMDLPAETFCSNDEPVLMKNNGNGVEYSNEVICNDDNTSAEPNNGQNAVPNNVVIKEENTMCSEDDGELCDSDSDIGSDNLLPLCDRIPVKNEAFCSDNHSPNQMLNGVDSSEDTDSDSSNSEQEINDKVTKATCNAVLTVEEVDTDPVPQEKIIEFINTFENYREEDGNISDDTISVSSISSGAEDVSSADEVKSPKKSTAGVTEKLKKKLPRTKGELLPEDLPAVEDLKIDVGDDVKMSEIGKVTSVVGILVVVQSIPDIPQLNCDTVLFGADKRALGKIFETLGPVAAPLYTVRFNSLEHIKDHGVEIGMSVYCVPNQLEWTKYIFTEHLRRIRGSDASWEDNNEPPVEYLDYSDDEEEMRAKAYLKHNKGVRFTQSGEPIVPPDWETFRKDFTNVKKAKQEYWRKYRIKPVTSSAASTPAKKALLTSWPPPDFQIPKQKKKNARQKNATESNFRRAAGPDQGQSRSARPSRDDRMSGQSSHYHVHQQSSKHTGPQGPQPHQGKFLNSPVTSTFPPQQQSTDAFLRPPLVPFAGSSQTEGGVLRPASLFPHPTIPPPSPVQPQHFSSNSSYSSGVTPIQSQISSMGSVGQQANEANSRPSSSYGDCGPPFFPNVSGPPPPTAPLFCGPPPPYGMCSRPPPLPFNGPAFPPTAQFQPNGCGTVPHGAGSLALTPPPQMPPTFMPPPGMRPFLPANRPPFGPPRFGAPPCFGPR